MIRLFWMIGLGLFCVTGGCGRRYAPPLPTTPLTQEQWNAIADDEEKFAVQTLERLKAGGGSPLPTNHRRR